MKILQHRKYDADFNKPYDIHSLILIVNNKYTFNGYKYLTINCHWKKSQIRDKNTTERLPGSLGTKYYTIN